VNIFYNEILCMCARACVRARACVCVCVTEREREKRKEKDKSERREERIKSRGQCLFLTLLLSKFLLHNFPQFVI
jgi:hypothetical protein